LYGKFIEKFMQRINLEQDVKPISEFRANAASLVQQVRHTKRPLVITQQGKSTAVLMDITEYESLLARLELLENIETAYAQLNDGLGINHTVARKKALKKVRK
jgi:antitoxin YefM